ncbi:methyl-accepting chemotaxis protein [Brevibacillus dissolubilis]|uniref:methyl-accepting chemotaxis protein n=1 Tax=Brevibacillus dissolubilis TaxID=1844116 RepID=UPI0011170221|nr:methyl-accepting chemotaxis protein [Brevibacillus dissolubilis]
MKFRSVRARTMGTILPILVLTLVVMVVFAYFYMSSTVNQEIDQKMDKQLAFAIRDVEASVIAHTKTVQSLTNAVEPTAVSIPIPSYQSLLTGTVGVNEDTFGMGLFFAPNRYNKDTKYQSMYVYKDNGKVMVTQEYNDPAYDYPSQDWYKIAASAKSDVVYTAPYFDELTKVTMVTAGFPLYDANKQFLGVMTGDMDLASIQNNVSAIKVGQTGWAFLLDEEGRYLASPQADLIMKKKVTEESNSELAELGKSMLAAEKGNSQYADENGTYSVYYQKVPGVNWSLALVMPQAELKAPVQSLLSKMALISIFAVLIVIAVIYLFSRYLTRQIAVVNELSTLLAAGDFTKQLEVKSEDEFGQMIGNFNRTTQNLRELLYQVATNAEQVAATSEQLMASAEQTSQSTEQIAESIGEVAEGSESQAQSMKRSAGTVTEVRTGMHLIETSTRQAEESSLAGRQKASEGHKVVTDTIGQMNVIHERISMTAEMVNTLGQKSAEVGNIITMITTIASQTNLLALNAAIEAARAGEQGRGFAVVADEVRKLAEQSSDAAGQVRAIISEIQAETTKAITAMQDGTLAVTDGMTMVNQTGDAFGEIVKAMDTLSTLSQNVAAQVKGVNAQMEAMAESFTEVEHIIGATTDSTQMVAAAAEEQTSSMQEIASAATVLSKMADELQSSVSVFKLS